MTFERTKSHAVADRVNECFAIGIFEAGTLSLGVPHRVDDLHRFNAYGHHTLQQVDHRFLVIGKVIGVELRSNNRVPWISLLVLIKGPLEG